MAFLTTMATRETEKVVADDHSSGPVAEEMSVEVAPPGVVTELAEGLTLFLGVNVSSE